MIEAAEAAPGIELLALGRPELDLAEPGNVAVAISAIRPDIVVNAAAYTGVDEAESDPERAFRINADAAGEVAAAARENGARLIQISTDYVFDGSSPEPYEEGSPTNPLSVYGRSKLEGEEKVRAAHPDHLIIRTAWVYSPFGRNFVKTVMAAAHNRDELRVVADQRGNPTAAGDLAKALLAVASAWGDGSSAGTGETFHLAGAGDASWYDFACLIFDEAARLGEPTARVVPIGTDEWPTAAVRPPNSRLSCSRFRQEFNWQMPTWRASVPTVVRAIAEARKTTPCG
jgi:dTDP-4-dehydrorhamnose reductase